ncbi:MAG TPA: hypothetical protein VGL99_00565 [Chloroflexota bacterium]
MAERLGRVVPDALSVLATIPTWRKHHLVDWVRSWLSASERNPLEDGMPWLAWPCIDWLAGALYQDMKVLEYGGGGSTLFFLSHGCQVTTVEGNSSWVAAIRARTARFRDRLDLRYVDSQTPDPALRRHYAAQAGVGGPWDLILVDGAFRHDCLTFAMPYLATPGIIIVDNTDLPEFADFHPEHLLRDLERTVFRGLGYARRRPTTTEVFQAHT